MPLLRPSSVVYYYVIHLNNWTLFFVDTGGNLCITLSLKAATQGVRLPDGILTSYAPFNVQFRPSPSRLLCLLDPLLPVGILTRCLAAYTGVHKNVPPSDAAQEKNTDVCENSVGISTNVGECGAGASSDIVNNIPLYSASEFDLVHCNKSRVNVTRSHSETDLAKTVEGCADYQKSNLSSYEFLTDDHVASLAKNPYLSPLAATDEQLALLPPVDLLVSKVILYAANSVGFLRR